MGGGGLEGNKWRGEMKFDCTKQEMTFSQPKLGEVCSGLWQRWVGERLEKVGGAMFNEQ